MTKKFPGTNEKKKYKTKKMKEKEEQYKKIAHTKVFMGDYADEII